MSICEKKRHILGITGNVGCGKSTLLAYMHERWDAEILELDKVAAFLQKKGNVCYQPMLDLLGEEVLAGDGEFDRPEVAKRIFRDEKLLLQVNGIVHPAVKRYVKERTGQERMHSPLMVIEAALLFEDHYEEICDEIWYIHTDPDVRAKRLRESRGYSDEKIAGILRSQKDESFFRARSDAVIDNSSDELSGTYEQIDRQMKRFLET